MRILRRTLVVLLVLMLVAVAGVVGVYWWQRPLLLTATGYGAHNACAVTEISARTDAEDDLPPNPLVPYLRTSFDGDTTTGSLFGLLARQQSWHTEGFGCTLAGERPELNEASAVSDRGNPLAEADEPAPDIELDDAIGRAFGDDLTDAAAAELGTRAVVIVKNGELVGERYADGFDASTAQLGWSMSKSATNLMVGMLVQQGVVALDDAGLREEWTDERADITVEHLLRMSSGLEWDETYDLGTPITRMLYLEEDMGAYVAGQKLLHEPGTVQLYSSGDTTLLCSVLAERTRFGADLPRQTLLGELGLSSAVFEPDAAGTPVCSSYLWATPRDWAALGQFALQNGEWNGEQLLPVDWMQRSLTVNEVEQTDDPGYGMGWRVNPLPDGSLRWPELPEDTYFASGHDGQRMLIVPSEDLVIVRLGFTPEISEEASVVQLAEVAITLLGERQS